jgi:hypothetical protein
MATLGGITTMRVLIGILCGLLVSCTAQGADALPVQVMVLGTYHMDNPGQDLHNVQAADVLTPARQAELAAVVKSLAAFRPTVLAVERVTAAPGYVDGKYAAFDGSQLARDRDERVQVGYRLAREAGLGTVHGIDEQPSAGEPDYFPFERVQASVHARGEDAALGAIMERTGRMVAAFGQRQASATIAELLRDANDPRMLANPSMYYEMLLLDAGEDQPGAELLGYWYMRNAKIAAKLMDIARPGDRVVVIFGSGHKHWLEQVLSNTPGFQVVDPLPYL